MTWVFDKQIAKRKYLVLGMICKNRRRRSNSCNSSSSKVKNICTCHAKILEGRSDNYNNKSFVESELIKR